MYPILVTLGPFTVHTYTALINLGVLVALGWLYFAAPDEREAQWLDAGLWALAGGVIGARLGYVLANGAYFAAHPGEALAVWTGGLSWPGAAAGALLGLWAFAHRRGLPIAPMLDALALPAVLLAGLGWGGCLASGCAYGIEVTPGEFPPALTAVQPDMFGLTLPRWPTQMAGVAYSLLSIGALYALRGRLRTEGALGWAALLVIALGAAALGFTREDPMPAPIGLRLDVWGSLAVLTAALVGLIANSIRASRLKTTTLLSPTSEHSASGPHS